VYKMLMKLTPSCNALGFVTLVGLT